METEIISKKEQARQRRLELKGLSNTLVLAAKNGLIPMENGTVNDLLKAHYSEQGHTTLKTYSQWKEEGYNVRKGEHALLLWAKPIPSKESKETASSEGKDEDEAKADYFPVIHLFSEKQVAKRK